MTGVSSDDRRSAAPVVGRSGCSPRIEAAIKEIAAGRAVVVVDDEDRENEGDLIFAAEKATPELMAFMIRYTSGFICVPMTEPDADRLDLPPMTTSTRTAAAPRTRSPSTPATASPPASPPPTARTPSGCSPTRRPARRTCPGPATCSRCGRATAGCCAGPATPRPAVDLAQLAGLRPAGVLCELVNDDGTMMRLPELRRVRRRARPGDDLDRRPHRLPPGPRAAGRAGRRGPAADRARRVPGGRLPGVVDGTEHVALVYGDLGDGDDVLVRVHSECLTGDVFGSLRCDCGPQLEAALRRVAEEGRGVVLYVRGHEGRGIGLMHKLQAYQLQDQGRDTVDANLDLGLPADARDYGTGAQILVDLGVRTMRLLTNNPAKRAGLEGYGLRIIGRESLPVRPHPENLRYLRTKRDRMGHLLDGLDSIAEGLG